MRESTDDEEGPDLRATALRYLLAAPPMVFHALIMAWAVGRSAGLYGRDAPLYPRAAIDLALGAAGLVALAAWRRRPLATVLVTALATTFSATATGPAYVAYVSLALTRGWRPLIPAACTLWTCLAVNSVATGFRQATLVSMATETAILSGLTALGLGLRGRRDLVASRRETELATHYAEQQRIEQARLAERVKIAQEMHDVLAHRISLLSMLAGGLAHRADLTAEQTRELAGTIQENAHQSLNELRAVLGSLRRDGPLEAPQPTLDHLEALFEEVRAAGQRVEVDDTVDGRELLPARTGRHAYRIVQEALTNARKHAPGSPVTAELGGRPGDGLRLRVRNPVPPGGASPAPGGRMGLIGMAERARMAGGTLHHTIQNGWFVLDARLPWEATPHDATRDRG